MRRLPFLLLLALVLWWPTHSWAITFTYHSEANGTADAASSTIASTDLAVTAGDLIVCGVKWESTTTAVSSAADNHSNVYVVGTAKANGGSNGEPHGHIFYSLAAANTSATTNVTATFTDASATFRRLRCVSYNVSTTVVLDVEANGAATTGSAPTTGAFSTVDTVEYVFALVAGFSSSEAYTLPLIGGNTATVRGTTGADTVAFDYTTAAAISSGTANNTMLPGTHRWTIVSAAFKATPAASGDVKNTMTLRGN